jgi:hypothetical protein
MSYVMTYQLAVASAETEKFQYDVNGWNTAIIDDYADRAVLLIDDGTGQTIARYPFADNVR